MRSAIAALAALTLVGCGAHVSSSLAPNTNLAQYRTFAFYRPPDQQGRPLSLTDQQIQASLAKNLAEKGMTEAPPGAADFLVDYWVVTEQKVEATHGPHAGWGYYGPVDVRTYTQGTLIVDFIDPRANRVFWRGTASDTVSHPTHVDPGRLDAAVSKLIDEYPYNVAAAPRPRM